MKTPGGAVPPEKPKDHTMSNTFAPAQIVALSSLFTAEEVKEAKASLPAGLVAQFLPFEVAVEGGTVTKAAAGMTVADTTALPWTSVLALAMHRSGLHAETLRTLCVDVLKGNLTEKEKAAIAKGDAMWDDVVKPLLPKRTNAPAVKCKAKGRVK